MNQDALHAVFAWLAAYKLQRATLANFLAEAPTDMTVGGASAPQKYVPRLSHRYKLSIDIAFGGQDRQCSSNASPP